MGGKVAQGKVLTVASAPMATHDGCIWLSYFYLAAQVRNAQSVGLVAQPAKLFELVSDAAISGARPVRLRSMPPHRIGENPGDGCRVIGRE